MFKQRATEPELMDLGPAHYSQAEYTRCLDQLGRIGYWLGNERTTRANMERLPSRPTSFLDVGCGGGHLASKLAQWYPGAQVVGIDLDAKAIEYAQNTHAPRSNLSFERREEAKLSETPKSFDVVLATLMCHHLSDRDIVEFLVQARLVARQAIIINDLHRHPVAWAGFGVIAPCFFPNRLIRQDGLLSIRKGFVGSDWKRYLAEAGIDPSAVTVRWHWPFRWSVVVRM